MIIKSQNKDLVVDTNGNEFRMFCGPDGRYAIDTRAGVLGVYKTKKQVEKVLDEIAEQIGCCKADEIIYAGRGIGGLRRPSIADGNVNSYQWSDATLVDISTHIAVFSVGEYCVTYKFCQLRDEVKEA